MLTSKNDGIKFSKKTPLDNPLIPCTIEILLPVKKKIKFYYFMSL